MKNWAATKIISLEPTVSYRPEANGVAEQANRSIMERANNLRFRTGLPGEFWELSVRAAIYLINRQPIGGRDPTPWTILQNETPDISHYRIWGCAAYVHIPKEMRGKLDKKCWKGIFVGYSTNSSKIYRIYHPEKKTLLEAQSVDFNENDLLNQNLPTSDKSDDDTYI